MALVPFLDAPVLDQIFHLRWQVTWYGLIALQFLDLLLGTFWRAR